MAEILPDTTIFIAILKGDENLKSLVENSKSAINTVMQMSYLEFNINANQYLKSNESPVRDGIFIAFDLISAEFRRNGIFFIRNRICRSYGTLNQISIHNYKYAAPMELNPVSTTDSYYE